MESCLPPDQITSDLRLQPASAFQNRRNNPTVLRMNMPRIVPCCLLLAAFAAAAPASAQQVGREQDIVDLRLGQRVLVDDGSCPAGQVKEVMGAQMTASGVARARKCVPRQGPKKKF